MLVARTVPQQAALAVVRIFARIVACIVAQIVARIVVRIVAGTGSRIVANACALGYARMRFGIYLGFFSRWLQVASGCCRRAEHQCLPAPAETQGSAGKSREEQGGPGKSREAHWRQHALAWAPSSHRSTADGVTGGTVWQGPRGFQRQGSWA